MFFELLHSLLLVTWYIHFCFAVRLWTGNGRGLHDACCNALPVDNSGAEAAAGRNRKSWMQFVGLIVQWISWKVEFGASAVIDSIPLQTWFNQMLLAGG